MCNIDKLISFYRSERLLPRHLKARKAKHWQLKLAEKAKHLLLVRNFLRKGPRLAPLRRTLNSLRYALSTQLGPFLLSNMDLILQYRASCFLLVLKQVVSWNKLVFKSIPILFIVAVDPFTTNIYMHCRIILLYQIVFLNKLRILLYQIVF